MLLWVRLNTKYKTYPERRTKIQITQNCSTRNKVMKGMQYNKVYFMVIILNVINMKINSRTNTLKWFGLRDDLERFRNIIYHMKQSTSFED